ncbi:MAG: flagellar basal body P-ring formation chaperone FlgA [Pseudomonadota bacterium]
MTAFYLKSPLRAPISRFFTAFLQTVLAFAWLFFALMLTRPANAAESGVFLKSDIVVTGETVLLSDVLTGTGAQGDVKIANAPAPGARVSLHPDYIAKSARALGLIWTNPEGAKRITVARASQAISTAEISNAVLGALRAQGLGAEFDLALANAAITLHAPIDARVALAVEDLSFDGASGRFAAVVSAGPDLPATTVAGRAISVIETPVLGRAMGRGEVIHEDDIVWRRTAAGRVPSTALLSSREIVGKALKRRMAAGALLASRDIERPKVVEKGAFVTIVYETSGLKLTTLGRALENGAEDETIGVMNVQTHRTIRAFVAGPNTVKVLAPFDVAALN